MAPEYLIPPFLFAILIKLFQAESEFSMTSRNKQLNIQYDEYGRKIQKKKPLPPFPAFLLHYFLPYIVINGLILFAVIAKPKMTSTDPRTEDFKTATLDFQIHSILPIKSVSGTLEGSEVEIKKEGNHYIAMLPSNGSLRITATSLNGMSDTLQLPVEVIDNQAPTVEKDSVKIGDGFLSFEVTDADSGVDFSSIYAIEQKMGQEADAEENKIQPVGIEKKTGTVTFSMKESSITVYISDLAGNTVPASFSVDGLSRFAIRENSGSAGNEEAGFDNDSVSG